MLLLCIVVLFLVTRRQEERVMALKNLAAVSKWGRICVVNSDEVREGVIIEFKDSHYDNPDICIRQYYRNEYGNMMSENLAEVDPAELTKKSPEKVTKKLRNLIKEAFGTEKTRIFIDKRVVRFFEVDEEAVKQEKHEEELMRGIS